MGSCLRRRSRSDTSCFISPCGCLLSACVCVCVFVHRHRQRQANVLYENWFHNGYGHDVAVGCTYGRHESDPGRGVPMKRRACNNGNVTSYSRRSRRCCETNMNPDSKRPHVFETVRLVPLCGRGGGFCESSSWSFISQACTTKQCGKKAKKPLKREFHGSAQHLFLSQY